MNRKYVVIDFETTGLSALRGQVVEIGAIKMENGTPFATFEVLLRPTGPVEPDALKAHGLTDGFLKENGKDPQAEWRRLADFIGDCDLIAHNGLGFDFAFLFNAFTKHGIAIPNNRLIDSLPLSQRFLETPSGKYTLEHICKAYDISILKAHRAMSDATALRHVMKHLEAALGVGDEMWDLCGRFELGNLGELPEGFSLMHEAIEQGLEIQIDYQGVGKPRRTRWVRPRGVLFSRGHRYIDALCIEPDPEEVLKPGDDGSRQFRSDRFFGVLQTRPRMK